jgi:predicted RNA-binding protein Jag
MSDNISQQELYKDKCLYATLNIMLSKIQRLEKRVHVLEAEKQNVFNMYNKKHINSNNNEIPKLLKHINKLELKLNEQQKIIKKYMENKEINQDEIATELDNYLKDIDDIMDFQIDNPIDFEKLKSN